MPRKPRVEYPGAIYHVMSRGNRGDAIFLDDRDYEIFLDTLGEACAKTGWVVHAFALMGNHYHLLLETPEANLVVGMKWLQGTYTQRFNSRHKLWGHLLQGRYKALPVDSASGGDYFPTAGNYIHLNPARARAFDLEGGRLSDYRWSSYPLYLRASKRPEWLSASRLLGSPGADDDARGRRWYREHMRKKVLEIFLSGNPQEFDSRWADIRRGWCYGSDDFRQMLLEHIDENVKGKRPSSFSGDEIKLHNEAEAGKLIETAMRKLGISQENLQAMRKSAPEKMTMAWLLKESTAVTNEWISTHLFCGHPANIPGYVRKASAATDGHLAEYKKMLKSED